MKPYQARLSKAILLFVLTAITIVPSFAQEVHQFSAKQSVEYASKNNVQVRNKLIDVQIRMQANREITAGALPTVSGNVDGTYYLKIPTNLLPGEFFGQPAGTYIPVKFGLKWNGSYGATLRQLLFDGQVFVGLQAREASMDYARHDAEVTEEQIKANVYKIYYQLVVGEKRLGLLRDNIDRTEKLLHDTRELFKNGFREQLDVDQTSVNLSNLKTAMANTDNQLRIGYIGLKYLMGMPVRDSLVLTDSVSETELRSSVLSDSTRYEDRKEYQMLLSLEKLGRYDVKRYRMSYLPTVSLTGSYSRNAQRNDFSFFKAHQPWFATSFVGININVPIFDGFAKDARIQQARLRLIETQNNLNDMRNHIDNEVLSAQLTMRTALSTLDEQHGNMTLAARVYDQTKKKYEQGLTDNLNVLSTENSMVMTQDNYFSAMYDAIVAKINYLKAIGKLN